MLNVNVWVLSLELVQPENLIHAVIKAQRAAPCYPALPHAAPEDSRLVPLTWSSMIDRGSPVPPWQQIYELLRDQIESGELAPGDAVPSIVTIHQTYGVAHTTARKALRRLVEDGLVVTSPMGTFVRKK